MNRPAQSRIAKPMATSGGARGELELGRESEAAMVVSCRMRRWLVLVAVAVALPLLGVVVTIGLRVTPARVVPWWCLAA